MLAVPAKRSLLFPARSHCRIRKLTAARAVREQEAKDFSKSETPLLDVVDTLQRGISVIQKEMAKNTAFLQKKIDTRTINNVVAALTPVVDTTAFECRQPEVGG